MIKKFLVLFALFLGLAADHLFWEKLPGVSFPIFVALCLISGYFLLNRDGFKPSKWSAALIPLILFLSMTTIFHREPLTLFLNYSLTFFLMALLAISWLGGSWISFTVPDYFVNFSNLFKGTFTLPWQISSENKNAGAGGAKNLFRKSTPVIRGLLIAIPIVLLFTALFASADLIFSSQIDALIGGLNLENLREFILRGTLIIMIAYLFSGVILFAAKRSGNLKKPGTDKPFTTHFLGFTESAIILTSVVILFGGFVLIQAKYFFSGQANVLLDGFTYAEYARKGFGELVTVAVFSIFLIKGLSVFSRRESAKQITVFSSLIATLVGLVLVILVSAFQRLSLYESAYGFTSSRTYAHVFIIWLGILLAAVIFMEFFKKQVYFANFLLAVILGFTVTLNILNPDSFIVKNNIRQADKSHALDISYLASLSNDAIPPLAAAFTSPDYSNEIHESIGAAIVCSSDNRHVYSETKSPWQSFTLSEWRAERALHKIENSLDGYLIDSSEWPARVITPDGHEFFCHNFIPIDAPAGLELFAN